MQLPKFTIITAALNPGPEVRQTIESVFSQNYANLEYIFVDGGSNSESFSHIEPYCLHFTHFIREQDSGISDAWNKAISLARGEIIGIINSDDYYLPGAIQDVATAFMAQRASPIIHGDAIRIEHDHHFLRQAYLPIWLMIRFGTPVVHPATFVPRSVYERIGSFNLDYQIAMDYDFTLRAYLAGVPFLRLKKSLVGFRGGGLSDRKPIDGFKEVRNSQLTYHLNRPLAQAIYTAKCCVRKFVRPLLGF